VRTDSGIRITRTPFTEIASLYSNEKSFKNITLESGENLLSGITAKTFDVEVSIDAAAGSAQTLTFEIADKTFVYRVAEQTLFGKPLPLRQGKLSLRIIADHAQLEVFANDGLFSYTAAEFFAPDAATVVLKGDGTVAITSAEFRWLERAWPDKAATSSQVVNDDAEMTYTGAWSTSTEARYHGGQCRVASAAGSSVELVFNGTRIDWYGLKNADLGEADIYVDGELAAKGVDLYDARRQNAQLFSAGGLTNGAHSIKVVATGEKHANSSGTALVHDYFITYVDP
jgi:hypothetical protein